jgi:hypothetical protein
MPVGQRDHHDAVVLAHALVDQAKQAAQAHQRQQTLAQRDHTQHVVRRVGHGRHTLRHLHNLLHGSDVDGVFLVGHRKRHQAQLIAGHRVVFSLIVRTAASALGTVVRTLPPNVRELAFHQAGKIQRQQHLLAAIAARALDHTGQEVSRHDRLDRLRRFHLAFFHTDHAGDLVNDKAQRLPEVDHQGSGRIIMLALFATKQLAQTDDGQDPTTQVGQAIQRCWRQRQTGHIRHTDDLLHRPHWHGEHLAGHRKGHELVVVAQVLIAVNASNRPLVGKDGTQGTPPCEANRHGLSPARGKAQLPLCSSSANEAISSMAAASSSAPCDCCLAAAAACSAAFSAS